jgi:hypothetical protein
VINFNGLIGKNIFKSFDPIKVVGEKASIEDTPNTSMTKARGVSSMNK